MRFGFRQGVYGRDGLSSRAVMHAVNDAGNELDPNDPRNAAIVEMRRRSQRNGANG